MKMQFYAISGLNAADGNQEFLVKAEATYQVEFCLFFGFSS